MNGIVTKVLKITTIADDREAANCSSIVSHDCNAVTKIVLTQRGE